MLQSQRVTLRSIQRADLPRQWQFNNDLAVELAGGGDPPVPQSLERLQAEFDRNASEGGRDGASFAIEVQGIFIGQCALFNFNDTNRTCELGITIGDKAYWGQGYGKEAVKLLLAYAFRYRNMNRVWLEVICHNARAIGAYKACGFTAEGTLRQHLWSNGRYADILIMGILREEWVKE